MGIVAQVIGTVGIALLLASTLVRRRVLLLGLDAVGSLVMGIHWALLGATAAVGISIIVVAMDLAGTDPRRAWGRLVIIGALPVACLVVALVWSGPADLLALIGMAAIAGSRLSRGQIRLRALATASAVPWGLYGVIMGSIPQMIFSTVYFIAMGISVVRIARGTWHPRPAAGEATILPPDGP